MIFLTFFKKAIDKLQKYDIIYKYEINAPLAQPDRVFGYEPKGQGFESLTARQKEKSLIAAFSFCSLLSSLLSLLFSLYPRDFSSEKIRVKREKKRLAFFLRAKSLDLYCKITNIELFVFNKH